MLGVPEKPVVMVQGLYELTEVPPGFIFCDDGPVRVRSASTSAGVGPLAFGSAARAASQASALALFSSEKQLKFRGVAYEACEWTVCPFRPRVLPVTGFT